MRVFALEQVECGCAHGYFVQSVCLCCASSLCPSWLDELGVSAAMEQDIVCKQTFVGSHYAMLDDQYNPLPVRVVF